MNLSVRLNLIACCVCMCETRFFSSNTCLSFAPKLFLSLTSFCLLISFSLSFKCFCDLLSRLLFPFSQKLFAFNRLIRFEMSFRPRLKSICTLSALLRLYPLILFAWLFVSFVLCLFCFDFPNRNDTVSK